MLSYASMHLRPSGSITTHVLDGYKGTSPLPMLKTRLASTSLVPLASSTILERRERRMEECHHFDRRYITVHKSPRGEGRGGLGSLHSMASVLTRHAPLEVRLRTRSTCFTFAPLEHLVHYTYSGVLTSEGIYTIFLEFSRSGPTIEHASLHHATQTLTNFLLHQPCFTPLASSGENRDSD